MPIQFDVAKTEVARTAGQQGNTAAETAAGVGIEQAIREFNARDDWEFKLADGTDITVTPGTDTYNISTLDAGAKRIYSARLSTNERILVFIRQREWDRAIRGQDSDTDIPAFYTTVEDGAGVLSIKIFPVPSVADTIKIRLYFNIDAPTGTDNLDVPDRYLAALIALSKYYFLADRDADNARLQEHKQRAAVLLSQAISDDSSAPDEDLRFIPQEEWIGAQGDDIFTLFE